MSDAYIVDAVRTPRGRGNAKGALYEVKPIDLVRTLLTALNDRNAGMAGGTEDLIMGISSAVGDQGSTLPRIAALSTPGWEEVPGMALQRFCGAGLEAVGLAAGKVKSGWSGLVVAGGVESMSRLPLGASGGPWFFDPTTSFKIGYVPQGFSADLLAALEDFSRDELDVYALRSQRLAAKAQAEGHFRRSLIEVKDQNGIPILTKDEYIRRETTLETLASLKPAFGGPSAAANHKVALQKYPDAATVDAVHTAGNSCGIVDGAALVAVASARRADELGLAPRARILAYEVVSVDPTIMLTGPVPAIAKALQTADLQVEDIDLFEVNEAFAVVPLYTAKALDIPMEKVNVNGGSIALGHPIGATGAMLLGTVLDELERRQERYGVAALCTAGGMGVAMVIERA